MIRFFFDSIKSAAKSLWAKKLRSALSILGIVIGILTISSLLTIVFGVRNEISSSVNNLGANLIFVLPGDIEQDGGFSAQVGASTLTVKDVDTIRSVAPEAQNVSAAMLVTGAVRAESRTISGALIFAGSPGVDKAFNMKLKEGRFPDANDESSKARVVVLGDKGSQDLFGEQNPVGRTIEIRGVQFKVIGLLEHVSSTGGLGGPDMNTIVLMPLQTGWDITNTQQIFRITMQAPDADTVDVVKDKVKAALLANHGGEKDFSVLSQDDLLDMVNQILNLVAAMVGAITAISLLVGGIGIMNIMLVTVSERTKEIGIRKSVGATRFAILMQFLVESMMLTLMAGVVAVSFFTAIVALVGSQSPIPIEVDIRVIGIALAFSGVIGIVFGVVPAIQASRKDPIAALRSE